MAKLMWMNELRISFMHGHRSVEFRFAITFVELQLLLVQQAFSHDPLIIIPQIYLEIKRYDYFVSS